VSATPLAELVEDIQSGFACGDSVNEGIVQLRMNNVDTEGTIDFATIRRVPADATKDIRRFTLVEGDVMFNNTNSPELVGKSAVFRGFHEPVVFSNHFTRIRVRRDRLDPRFLARWLVAEWKTGRFARMCNQWVNQASVRKDALLSMTLPTPPLAYQHRIAEILDKADAIRRERKEAIALTEELQRSAFLEMFGDPTTNPKNWLVKRVGDVAEVAGGLQVTNARASYPIQLPYLRVANVYRDRLDLSEVKVIRVTSSERDRAVLQVGDVLVVEGHGNREELGRAAVWSGEIPDCTHQNHLIRVRVGDDLRPQFLSAFLNSSAGRAQMLKLGKTTSGLNTISTNNVRSVKVEVPPLELQDHFCRFVKGARTLAARMQRRRHDEDLFQALIGRAFSGQLSHSETAC
jgi:type I restriction enzyme S subunit